METNMLKWYGHVLHMRDNRLPKGTFTLSLEGKKEEKGAK
jgi:hypothetical protein